MAIRSFVFATLFWAIPSFADETPVGVAVRGSIQGCDRWRERLLDLQRIENPAAMSLVGFRDVDIRGLDPREISNRLGAMIQQETGRQPTTLLVEFVYNDADFHQLVV